MNVKKPVSGIHKPPKLKFIKPWKYKPEKCTVCTSTETGTPNCKFKIFGLYFHFFFIPHRLEKENEMEIPNDIRAHVVRIPVSSKPVSHVDNISDSRNPNPSIVHLPTSTVHLLSVLNIFIYPPYCYSISLEIESVKIAIFIKI